ncbi:MAG: transposase family protein [bacterium]|nr:transposase family protein [bacterium]
MQTHTFPTLDEHYRAILGLVEPWVINRVDLDIKEATLTIRVSYNSKEGACAECGVSCIVEDLREERSWRHLDMMQFTTTIVSRVPRVCCKKHKTKTIDVPWAGTRSHLILSSVITIVT